MAMESIFNHTVIPIDCEELLHRCMGNFVLMQRLLKKFMDQVGADVETLVSAIEKEDVAEVARLSHKVRGTSLSVSALGLARTAQSIEMLVNTADTKKLRDLAENLENERIRIFNFIGSGCIAANNA